MKVLSKFFPFAVGLLGVVLSIYFYLQQREIRAVSFVHDPRPTLLFSEGSVSSERISLVDSDGDQIRGNVFSTSVFIWNSGTETIRKDDLIVPLKISSKSDIKLLDARIDSISRSDVNMLAIKPDFLKNVVLLDFLILEAGEGAKIYLLFCGSEDVQFHLDGAIAGIKEFSGSRAIVDREKWFVALGGLSYLVALTVGTVALLFLGAGSIDFIKKLIKRLYPSRAESIFATAEGWIQWCGATFFIAVLIWFYFTFFDISKVVVEKNLMEYVPPSLR